MFTFLVIPVILPRTLDGSLSTSVTFLASLGCLSHLYLSLNTLPMPCPFSWANFRSTWDLVLTGAPWIFMRLNWMVWYQFGSFLTHYYKFFKIFLFPLEVVKPLDNVSLLASKSMKTKAVTSYWFRVSVLDYHYHCGLSLLTPIWHTRSWWSL